MTSVIYKVLSINLCENIYKSGVFMPNFTYQMLTRDLNTEINYLKNNLLRDCWNNLDKDHYLYNFKIEYENWVTRLPIEIPEKVLTLGTYAKAIKSFRVDFSEEREENIVKKKLCDKNHVKGIIFEFLSCIHFAQNNKIVKWLPNLSNISEADLRVHHNNSDFFFVECTTKNDKPKRLFNDFIFIRDIMKSLREKRKQTHHINHPRLVSIYIPEFINTKNSTLFENLERKIKKKFNHDKSYETISAVTIVINTNIQVKTENENIFYDTDLFSWTLPNNNAIFKLPPESINPGGY